MKKANKFIFCIIAVLVVVIGIVTIFQWDNIEAIYLVKTRSDEEIEKMFNISSAQRKEAVSGLPVRELTEEEQENIKCGKLSTEDALNRIVNIGTNGATSESNPTTQQASEKDYEAELADLIGQIYVLEATYSGAVDNLISSAIAEYKALPPEQHTDTNKWNIGAKYLGTATSMEATCDQQMATILSQIESVLVKSGKDVSLVNKIKSAYQSEKIYKKNYYLSLYS